MRSFTDFCGVLRYMARRVSLQAPAEGGAPGMTGEKPSPSIERSFRYPGDRKHRRCSFRKL
ncbi:hypothetical protein [Microbulbifer guangxiensis]|uniref:hypothetical protein n=1 Tax=Microbulbifer guangxiensis TaxID=2904249 RepID=UPI001F1E8111|nr:hypothetical protein [Microbulbifer guangxiensis]